jgi:chromosome segregation ATPase
MSNDTNAGPVLPELPLGCYVETSKRGVKFETYSPEGTRAYGLQCWNACDEQVAGPLRERIAELQGRLRSVCQTLVGAVGADGPCNAEDAAARAVERIAELERQNDGLQQQHHKDSKELRALCEQRDEYIVRCRQLGADKRALLQGSEEQRSEISRLRAENEALKKALVDHWRAAVTLQNSVVETNGVAGMDGMSAANDAARDLLRAIDAARAAREGRLND